MQPETGSGISLAFSWSETLFHVKHILQVFPLHCIQLHSKGKEIAFLPHSSFDMAAPADARPLGLLRGCKGKAGRRGGFGLVCTMRARWGCTPP